MGDTATAALGALQSLLAWFQENRSNKSRRKEEALLAVNVALVESMRYVESQEVGGPQNREKEYELGRLWREAAIKIMYVDKGLSSTFNEKSMYWLERFRWSREEVLRKRIDFLAVHEEVAALMKK